MSIDLLVDWRYPDYFKPVSRAPRYVVLYGGRGSAKSYSVAQKLIEWATADTLRIWCAREFQESIQESVHSLLKEVIQAKGLGQFWDIQKTRIVGRNGSEFIFSGLRVNPEAMKGKQGVDIVWVEEGENGSDLSWDLLIPTIRKEGSQIFVTFNPRLDKDPTYVRFVKNTPHNCLLIKANWRDNPWFPEVLNAERLHMLATDPDKYAHIWEGECRRNLSGSVYAAEIRFLHENNRIVKGLPLIAGQPVHTFWDLGYAHSAVWFAQRAGAMFNVINYRGFVNTAANHAIAQIQAMGYPWGVDYLPHDGGTHDRSIGIDTETVLRDHGRTVARVKKLKQEKGIDSTRVFLQNCFFDETNCQEGLWHMYNFRYDEKAYTERGLHVPIHDQHSHACDALRYMAVAMRPPQGEVDITQFDISSGMSYFKTQNQGWMG